MKRKFMIYSLAAGMFLSYGCGEKQNKQDSTEVAQEQNEQKADDQPQENKKENDAEFMVNAASGGLMEVELAAMALKTSASAQVKAFAQMILTDHTKANEELKAIAARKNITVPATMGEDHQKHVTSMAKEKGADFDRKYMEMMVEDHEEDVEQFEKASKDATDAEIKNFALATLPTLQKHLAEAKKVKEGLK